MPAQISLQLAQSTYRPGETVHGVVHLTALHDLRPRGIIIHALGEEVTTLGPNTLMSQRSISFEISFNLWSPPLGGATTAGGTLQAGETSSAHADKLPKGEHDFPFEFALPPALPPTFSGEFTRIVYLIAAKVDLPLQADIRHEHPFTVLPEPLTEPPRPVRAAVQSPHGVRAELALNASSFYPGDHVRGTLQVTGAESITLTAAIVEIVSREKAEAHEFADHFDKVRVRAEIDPARLSGGQPFPIDLPIPEDADPSFVGRHSAKSRLVRARIDCATAPSIIAEAVIRVGAK